MRKPVEIEAETARELIGWVFQDLRVFTDEHGVDIEGLLAKAGVAHPGGAVLVHAFNSAGISGSFGREIHRFDGKWHK